MFYNYKKNFFYHEKVDHKICDMLINFYENNPNKSRGRVGATVNQRKQKVCSEVSPSFKKDVTHSAISSLYTTLDSSCTKFVNTFPFTSNLYLWDIDDGFNIQVYAPGEAYHNEHCEHGPENASCKRILAWMLYLNDVTDKGGTKFPHQNITLKAKKGDLWMWPAGWTHSHMGIPSPSQVKYIATGWATYKEFCYNESLTYMFDE